MLKIFHKLICQKNLKFDYKYNNQLDCEPSVNDNFEIISRQKEVESNRANLTRCKSAYRPRINVNDNSNINKSFTNLISKNNKQISSEMNQKNDLNKNFNCNGKIDGIASSNYKTFTNLYSDKINHQRK